MNPKSSYPSHSWLFTIVCIVLTGVLFLASTGLDGIGLLVWFAPIPILVLAFQSSRRVSLAASFLAYLIGGLNLVSYLSKFVPGEMIAASIVVTAIAFSLSVAAARFIVLRVGHWTAILVFPAAWTSYEYLLSLVSPHGTAGSLAYTQAGFLPFIQIASLAGLSGIVFLLTLFSSGIAVGWHRRLDQKQSFQIFRITSSILLIVLLFGWMRLTEPPSGRHVRVGLAVTDTTVRYFETTKARLALPVVDAYTHRVNTLAFRGAQVVLLPEKFVGITQSYDTTVFRTFMETAQENKIFLILGLNTIEARSNRNTAFVFSPEGEAIIEYNKVHLLPGLESRYKAGHTPAIFSLADVPAGVAICKDMDFPAWFRPYGRAGTGVLFVPAWDFLNDARLHSRMAMMRGVENGFAVVRCAQEGLVTVSDHCGRVIAEASSSSAPEVLMVCDFPLGPGQTFYSYAGDWLAWLSILYLVLMIAGTAVYRVRRRYLEFVARA
jgi:apolipoprotein N-acyltransferase